MAEADGRDLQRRLERAAADPTRVVLEGFHALKHALRFGARVELVVAAEGEDLAGLADELAPDVTGRLAEAGLSPTVVPAGVLGRLTPRPPAAGGVLAVAARPAPVDPAGLLARREEAPVVLLEGPTHLGNVGAAVRVAAAAGAGGLLVTGAADPWHPVALRGGAGLQYALPVEASGPDGADLVQAAATAGRPVVAVDPEGAALGGPPVPRRCLLAFGTERHGLSRQVRSAAARTVRIPMRPGVSSLNLATAVAVVLYTVQGLAPDGRAREG